MTTTHLPPTRSTTRRRRHHQVRRTGQVALACAVLMSALAGCTRSDVHIDDAATTTTPAGSIDATTPAGDPDDSSLAEVRLVRVEVDLDSPITAIALPPGHGVDNGLIVAERAGTIRVVDLDTTPATVTDPILDISADVSTDMERGLLGLALGPDVDQLFISFTDSGGTSQLESYDVSWRTDASPPSAPLVVDIDSRRTLLSVEQPYANHNGGHIEFGPDALLYMGLGDGGAGGDPHGNAQDRSTLLGKMLRLDPTVSGPDGPIPADNPFVGVRGARPEIWATGLRNPWQFSFDPATGDLWIADVGQDRFEEIDHLAASDGGGRGANLGWDLYEGTEPFPDADPAPSPASDGPFVEPVFTDTHGPGCSITGGMVYRGRAIPPLVGRYLFSDLCDGRIRTLAAASGAAGGVDRYDQIDLPLEVDQPVGFAADTLGEVYVISLTDGIYRIESA